LRPGCSAIFSIALPNGSTEGVVMVAEVRDGASSEECNKIIETSREQISLNHGVSLYAVCLLTQRSIPKTTSGKIARSWCRRAYLEGTLSIVKAWQSSTDPSTADEGEDSKFVDELPAQSHKLEIVTAHNAEVSLGASGEDDEGVVAEGSRLVAPFTAADIREMGVQELEALLETKLVEVGGGSQGEQTDALKLPIDRHRSLMSLGLDSMTIVQFKGVLENRFFCTFPDEFIFSDRATLHELAEIVKRGHLSDEQKEYLASGQEGQGGEGNASTVVDETLRKPPLCPWFTCCY